MNNVAITGQLLTDYLNNESTLDIDGDNLVTFIIVRENVGDPQLDTVIHRFGSRVTLFEQALARMREEQKAAGRGELFEELKQYLIEDAASGEYNITAAKVNMTPNAVAVTVHRWRERYKKLVHEEIVRTVADPSEIEDELHRFFSVLDE